MAAQRGAVKTTYALERTIQPIYSGGSVSLSEDGRILAACLGEDAMLTDLHNGRELGRIEGVSTYLSVSCYFYDSFADTAQGWRTNNSVNLYVFAPL